MDRTAFLRRYLEDLRTVLQSLSLDDVERVLQRLEVAFTDRRMVFIVGNGGSAATASHMASDLMLGVAKESGQGFRVIALTDNVPSITAIANDYHYTDIFSVQLQSLGQVGDVLIAISGSGNSPNVVAAVQAARQIGMTTIGFLGMGGGELGTLVDDAIIVPSDDYGPIEDVHMVLDHLMTAYFRRWQHSQQSRRG